VKLVLDTNVVIDWLVFDDPYMAAFREAVVRREITVVTHAHAQEELRRVLAYPALKLDDVRQSLIFRRYLESAEAFAGGEAVAKEALPKGFPRCRDPDDDPFLCLAFRSKAVAPVSRDNEVLALRRRATRFGFRILDVPQMMELVFALSASGSGASAQPVA
jgi:putative PIN family toxin of toxin-antitoxin system